MPQPTTKKDLFVGKKFEFNTQFSTKEGPLIVTDEYIDITGFASTNGVDRQGDMIPVTTWQDPDSIKNYLKNPILLAYHDMDNPVGKVLSLEIKDGGLLVTARVYRNADEQVFNMVKAGVLKTFSIGFMLKDMEYDEATGCFVITKLEMYELSVVSVPANQDCLFSIMKQLTDAGCKPRKDESTTEAGCKPQNKPKQENAMPTQNTNNELTTSQLVAKSVEEALAKRDAEQKAAALAQAEAKSREETMVKSVASIVTDQTTKLVEDIKKSLADEKVTMSETIAKFQKEIEEKSAEITALTKSKMVFGDSASAQTGPVSREDRENAVLLGKLLGKGSIDGTKFGKEMRAKAAGFNSSNAAVHVPGDHTVNNADWETEFNTNFWMDVRRQLVVEPMFRTINMNSAVMRLPVVPDQGYASYVAVDDLKSSSSVAAVNAGNRPTEITLTAHKLSASDRIGNEETEDSILPILPLIRENLMRRMARSSDRSLLRGVGATAADPIIGLAKYASNSSNTTSLSIGGGDSFTALALQQARRKMGVFGMRAADIAYILSTDAYYDLLEDPDMRKYFDVGPNNATILTGEVARVNGSPIIISDEFATKANGATGGLIVNMRNFVIGNLRNVSLNTFNDVAQDSLLLVATRRFGLAQMEAGAVVAINWAT